MGKRKCFIRGVNTTTTVCMYCDKFFRCNPRMAKRLIDIHQKQVHGIKNGNDYRVKVAVNGYSNKNNPNTLTNSNAVKKINKK